MKVTGSQAQCGEWNHTQRELAYVTVCEAPAPAEGFKGMFTYEPVEDTIYQMINQVDTSVYGCIERIRWDVFKDGDDTPIQSVSAWSPKINFPSEGKYRVVLNVGAPGELYSADELVIEVESAGGCSSVPASVASRVCWSDSSAWPTAAATKAPDRRCTASSVVLWPPGSWAGWPQLRLDAPCSWTGIQSVWCPWRLQSNRATKSVNTRRSRDHGGSSMRSTACGHGRHPFPFARGPCSFIVRRQA